METVRAKWFLVGRRGVAPRLIVIHCTVSPEMGTGAEAVARYFQSGTRRASAHRTADNNSTVISVADGDTAFAAAGANQDGLHLELVGMPQQTREQWADDYSTAELFQAGLTVREWSAKYDIPLRWLTVQQVADGRSKGLCTHHDVSRAFPKVSTGHWDPGPHFPKDEALRIWTPETEAPPTPENEDDMAYIIPAVGNHPTQLWSGSVLVPLKNPADVKAAEAAGCARLPLSDPVVDDIKSQVVRLLAGGG